MNGPETPERRFAVGGADEPAAPKLSPGRDGLNSLIRELAVGVWAFAALACADEMGLLDALTEP